MLPSMVGKLLSSAEVDHRREQLTEEFARGRRARRATRSPASPPPRTRARRLGVPVGKHLPTA